VGQEELIGPLTQFQCVSFNKPDLRKLMNVMNGLGDKALIPVEVLEKSFDMWWPGFQSSVERILAKPIQNDVPKKSDSEIMFEILNNSRAIVRVLSSAEMLRPNVNHDIAEELVSRWEDVIVTADQTDSLRPVYKSYSALQQSMSAIFNEYRALNSHIAEMIDNIEEIIGRNDPRHRFQLGDAGDMYGSE
jgi:hypothetical protein